MIFDRNFDIIHAFLFYYLHYVFEYDLSCNFSDTLFFDIIHAFLFFIYIILLIY